MRLGSALPWITGALAALATNCGSTDDGGLFNSSGGVTEGSGGDGGNAGASGGVGGSAGTGGIGGAAGFGASPDGGQTGGSSGSGATGGGNCSQYCGDSDGDGHGDPSKRPTVCDNLGKEWVTVCDDCHDQNHKVFPGATACEKDPYTLADGVTESFDYDCNGSVTECGEVVKAMGNCAPSTGYTCTGAGYVENPDRADAGVEAYCGSTRYRVCNRTTPITCGAATETREAVTCL